MAQIFREEVRNWKAFAAFACVLVLFMFGRAAEGSSSLKVTVSLHGRPTEEDFLCEVKSRSFEGEPSELNLVREGVAVLVSTADLGEFSCWRIGQQLGVPASVEVLEDLSKQIQALSLTRKGRDSEVEPERTRRLHFRSLLTSGGDQATLDSVTKKNNTHKTSSTNGTMIGSSKKDLGEPATNGTVDTPSEKAGPTKNNTDTSHKEDLPKTEDVLPKQTTNSKNQTSGQDVPSNPLNESGAHQHSSDDNRYNVCGDGNKLFTQLQTTGDGNQVLTLSLRNDGDGSLDIEIKTPDGLMADPSEVHLNKGDTSRKVNITVVDEDEAKHNKLIIRISSSEGECVVPINKEVFGFSGSQPFFDRFTMPTAITPRMGIAMFLFTMCLLGGFILWCTWSRWGHREVSHSYQELEMTLPSAERSPSFAQKEGKAAESGDEGWDGVWDDSWEDTEAARSSSRLIPNLSAKGLAARRSNKDGWDNSWED